MAGVNPVTTGKRNIAPFADQLPKTSGLSAGITPTNTGNRAANLGTQRTTTTAVIAAPITAMNARELPSLEQKLNILLWNVFH